MKGLPFSVGKFLLDAIARVRRIRLVRGIAMTGTVWILGVVAVMTVDSRTVIFDDRWRWAMTAAVLLAAAVTAMVSVVLPLCRRLDLRRMATTLDRRHPEQEERLSTLVELSERDAAKSGFSASLFAMVCDLAENDTARLDLRREFPLTGVWRRLAVFLSLALALGIGSAVSPKLIGLLFVRAVAPWADIGNLFSDEIVVKPGDMTILSGSVIRIAASPAEGERTDGGEYCIRISRKRAYGWSDETTETMAGGVYETTADLNEREWRYRVTSGHAVTRYYHVRVSQMPKYDLFTATVEFPAYTRMRPLVLSNADVTAISAIQGSHVKFEVQVSEPGTLADFRIAGEPFFEYAMVSNRTSEWSLDLVNADGFRAAKGRHPLKSFIDQPPTLVVENPSGKLLKLPPHAKIPVELTGSDDVRVLPPTLRYAIDDDEMRELRTVESFSSAGGNLWRGKTELDLTRLELTTARKVRFDFVTSDTCPPQFGGPHVVTSSVINVELEYQQWGFEVADLAQQKREADALIREASERLRTAERLARELTNELRREGPVNEASERKNETAAHEASEARKRLNELKDRFEGDERFRPLVKPLEKTLKEKVAPAADGIESSPFRERTERAPEMERAANNLHEATDELKDLADRLGARFEKVEALEKAKDLAERQNALAKTAKDILAEKPKDPAKLEAWKRLEQEAMRRAEELSRNLPDADFAEARRKMETAARKIEELGRQLDRAEKEAAGAQQEAAQRAEAEKQAAARQAQELAAAAADQQRAAQALARNDFKNAAAAQRGAEDHLERAEATEPVKALQQMASEAARTAAKAPQTAEKTAAAQALQKQAAEALAKEQAVRAAMAKGEKTADDLAALEDALRDEVKGLAAQRTAAAKDAASQALAAAKDAIGSEDQEKIDQLADVALEAKRDELGAVLEEGKLNDDEALAEAARATLDALDAAEAADAEVEALEKNILSGQQQALEAMRRNDRGRAANLQNEIAKAQARAAENSLGSEDADDAREAANAAQESAQEELADANGNWNEATRGEAVTAQERAQAAERSAQEASRAARTLGKIAAAGKRLEPPESTSSGKTAAKDSGGQAAEAAQDAADAMTRAVNAQATALGMRRSGKGRGRGKRDEKDKSLSSGGGISDEVSHLAKELRRNDGSNFLKSLFARLGWFKIRGLAKDGIDDLELKDVPREYRDLVRRYFLKLAAENPEADVSP